MTVEQRLVKVIETLEKIAEAQVTSGHPEVAISALATAQSAIYTLATLPVATALPPNFTPAKEEPKAAAAEQKPAEKPKETKKLTKDDIGNAVRAAVATHGADKVKAFIVSTYNVERASAVPEEKWQEVIDQLKAIK